MTDIWSSFPDAEDDPWSQFPDAQPAPLPPDTTPLPPVGTPTMPFVPRAPIYGEDGVTPIDQSAMPPGTAWEPPTMMSRATDAASWLGRKSGQLLGGANEGMARLAGLPVDVVNIIMGAAGVPVSDKPLAGGESLVALLRGEAPLDALPSVKTGLNTLGPEPADGFERGLRRVGTEIGASTVPVIGLAGRAAAVGVQGAKQMGRQAQSALGKMYSDALESAAYAPKAFVRKEGTMAAGAGTGAAAANEIAGNPQTGDNFTSDFLGSMAGVGATNMASGVTGVVKNLAGAATRNPNLMDDIAREAVAIELLRNSTDVARMQAQRGEIDTAAIVSKLRRPSAAEEAVPGFQANIGDRTQDPGLSTYAYNQDGRNPGRAAERRGANEMAVDERMRSLEPTGSSGEFRTAIQGDVDRRIADANVAAEAAQSNLGAARDAVRPNMPDATARGSSLRAALDDAFQTAKAGERQAWEPVNNSRAAVPMDDLAARYEALQADMPVNDARRFTPPEAALPAELAQAEGGNQFRQITSIRNGLTNDIRALEQAGEMQAARVRRQFLADLDTFVDSNIPPDLQQAYQAARQTTFDVNERFGRPGTAMDSALRTREGGGYQLDDSAVARQFTPTDQGRVTDFRALMREAGTDPRARDAIADEIMTQAQGVLDRPEALRKFLSDRNIVMSEFPELRSKLDAVGVATGEAKTASKVAADTARDLTTPGRSPEASYLRYGDERTVDAVRSVLSAGKPQEAARQLIKAAGGDARALNNARSAFWQVVKDTGQNSASSSTGNRVWNGRKLRDFLEDPKSMAVAREMYRDQPEALDDIERVFRALADADGSVRAKAAGTSGTGQVLGKDYDPALTAASVASRLRSVNRGQLSPTIAGIDLLGTWLRRRAASVQSGAINDLASAAVNDPRLAADLLEEFNPADWAARRRMLTQKYGVRATQVLNYIDEALDEEGDMKEAIER